MQIKQVLDKLDLGVFGYMYLDQQEIDSLKKYIRMLEALAGYDEPLVKAAHGEFVAPLAGLARDLD